MKIGFTGTRNPVTNAQRMELTKRLTWISGREHEFHHGGCVGADNVFHMLCRQLCSSSLIALHPPLNPSLRALVAGNITFVEMPYLVRNKSIVDNTECLIAMPDGPERVRSGTWSTVRYAAKQGKPVLIIWPDGHVTKENYGGSNLS